MGYNFGFPKDAAHPDNGWKLWITSLVMVISAGLVVIARLTTRIKARQVGSDDYAICVSIAFSIVLSIFIQLAVNSGYGMHKADLTHAQLTRALKYFFVAQTPYKVVVCFNKISVILLTRRIFHVQRAVQIACWVSLAVVIVWSIGSILATIIQCMPIEAAWNKQIKGKCINSDQFWLGYAVTNLLTDFLVLLLPLPSIYHLHLSRKDRLGLGAIFLLGGFVVFCGVARVVAVKNSEVNRADITYNFISRGIWTLIEANVGIICACLPLFRHLYSRCLSFILSQTRKSTTRGKSTVRGGTDVEFDHLPSTAPANRKGKKSLPMFFSNEVPVERTGYESDQDCIVKEDSCESRR